MEEKNNNIQQINTTNDDLDFEMKKMYDAKIEFEGSITDSIIKRNVFWMPTVYDEDTGLKEIIITEDDIGEDCCTAYTYPDSGIVSGPKRDGHSYGIFTLDEIYREMIHEEVDYLTLISRCESIDIDITELYEIMTDLEGEY